MGALFDQLRQRAEICREAMAQDLSARTGWPIEEARGFVDEQTRQFTEDCAHGSSVTTFYGPGLAERIYGKGD